jgi:hypothetical protein
MRMGSGVSSFHAYTSIKDVTLDGATLTIEYNDGTHPYKCVVWRLSPTCKSGE